MLVEKDEIIPNISSFLVGQKTAIPQKENSGSRNWLVSFKIEIVRTYKVAAKTKGMASELGRNRLRRTIKNMKRKHATQGKRQNMIVSNHKFLSTRRA